VKVPHESGLNEVEKGWVGREMDGPADGGRAKTGAECRFPGE